ncbi:amidohydrolase family protein [Chryseosolibacter indicus]|uniref:Amidohydrolase family protein n=1 Tax=Chryseosolibacter indicus TaxID=2782351 RepID=A0ABS5VU67_9BACT|nr:amidohydrolase family protein [Chryseosolibacter indicus]MBT1704968.1 amidohydrolase family protein [Chryseosolibacter indicus]
MKILQYRFLTVLLLLCAGTTYPQNPKAKFGTYALTNASIETITKGVINNGTVVISNGKIAAVGTNVQIPQGAEVIDCKGKWIYPGMIDGGTKAGLFEFGQVAQANDVTELGDVIPQMKALTAINPNSAGIPITRISGVTTTLTVPGGELFAGTAALVNLHGYTPDQMAVGFQAVVLNYPRTGRRGFFDRRTDEEIKKATDKAIQRVNEVWDKAVEYHKLDSATKGKMQYYPEMQALLPVVRGEMTLIIDVDAAKDIQAAIKWVGEKKIKKVILSGVAEGWRVADEIAKANIPVIAGPVLSLPTRDYDKYDRPYSNPGSLRKAGVKVAIKTEDDNVNYRNLPYHAGFAAAYGMGREEALRAVTIVPAEIFGVADRLGSIEQGKSATLFVCDGDPFETKTQVSNVFIDGWNIPMVSRQTLLYDEFLNREPGLTKEK